MEWKIIFTAVVDEEIGGMVQSEHASIYLNMDTWMMYMSVLLQNLLIT